MSKIANAPALWYVGYWTCVGVLFLLAVRWFWVQPLLDTLQAILTELRR